MSGLPALPRVTARWQGVYSQLTRLSRQVAPPSASCSRWCASQNAGGRWQPRATQPWSRAANANR